MGFIREIWETLHAVGVVARRFFVRWFLPVHGDEEPEKNDRWDFEDEPKIRTLPDVSKDEPVTSGTEPESYDPDEPQPVIPLIAPPAEADERVARDASPAAASYDKPDDTSAPDAEPDSSSQSGASAPSESDETNPFSHDKPTGRS